MKKMHFPHVILPQEFVQLLKSNLPATNSAAVFEGLKANRGLYEVLDVAFKEFNDGRGLEKTMVALGWANFRDRFASLYIYKAIHGRFPLKTDMGLVEDILRFESLYSESSVSGQSRAFLLGFYLKLAQIKNQETEKNKFLEFRLPEDILVPLLKLSQGRAEKIDWLLLILFHLAEALGEKSIAQTVVMNRTFDDIYQLMPEESRKHMHENLLTYGLSIYEPETFLYQKV